jgi:UPF0176 protein
MSITTPFQVLLYYKYFPIEDPQQYVADHRALCEELDLRGRVLVAKEGLNGTLSGKRSATEHYIATMQGCEATHDVDFKIDPADGHVFEKLSIKARDEIVTLGLPNEEDIDPNQTTGVYLSPKEFYAAMQDPNAVVLDGRNDYEWQLGRFQDALCPDVGNFRDFPEWIRKHRADLEGKRILTYCTGGIRCEKLSGFLLQEGFTNVSQLHGGIVTYGRDEEIQGRDFDGQCYVFDQRVGVPVNTANPKTISTCAHCGEPCDRYRNCGYKPCNAQFFCCESCEDVKGRFCHESCCSNVVGNTSVEK